MSIVVALGVLLIIWFVSLLLPKQNCAPGRSGQSHCWLPESCGGNGKYALDQMRSPTPPKLYVILRHFLPFPYITFSITQADRDAYDVKLCTDNGAGWVSGDNNLAVN